MAATRTNPSFKSFNKDLVDLTYSLNIADKETFTTFTKSQRYELLNNNVLLATSQSESWMPTDLRFIVDVQVPKIYEFPLSFITDLAS